jgi:hypothetical protein
MASPLYQGMLQKNIYVSTLVVLDEHLPFHNWKWAVSCEAIWRCWTSSHLGIIQWFSDPVWQLAFCNDKNKQWQRRQQMRMCTCTLCTVVVCTNIAPVKYFVVISALRIPQWKSHMCLGFFPQHVNECSAALGAKTQKLCKFLVSSQLLSLPSEA